MNREEKFRWEREFKHKWNAFIKRENCLYTGVSIRAIRKKDNLVLLTVSGLGNYVQLHLDDIHFKKISDAFQDDENVSTEKSGRKK